MNTAESIKKAVCAVIAAEEPRIAAWADYFWKNPEPGYREVKTAAYAVKILRELGLTVRENLALTGFRADLDFGRPGPCVAILGELDALLLPGHPECDPATGAVHACGHHTHITSLLAAATGLCRAARDGSLCGSVAFIGTPAEECIELEFRKQLIDAGRIAALGGKAQLLREHVFDDVDAAIMIHVTRDSYGGMDSNGFIKKMVKFKGRSCHAASPHNGVNAMNAADLAQHAIALLRETWCNDSRIRVHGLMSKCGDSINIIPDDTRLEYQIRADDLEKLRVIGGRFDRAMRGCAAALGAECEIVTLPGYMPMKNDPELYRLYIDEVKALEPGSDGVIYFDAGCTDMGDVGMVVPAIHPFAPGAEGGGHTCSFRVPEPGPTCVRMGKLLANFAVELLHGDAAAGRRCAERKTHLLSLSDYIAKCDALKD